MRSALLSILLLLMDCGLRREPVAHSQNEPYRGANSSTELTAGTYRHARAELFEEVYQHRGGSDIELTEAEQRVADHLEALKARVLAAGGGTWPAQSFFVVKQDIEETALFSFLQAMPKGGMLHIHAGAMGDMQWLIQEMASREDGFVHEETGSVMFSAKSPGPGWIRLGQDRAQSEDPALYDSALAEKLTLGLDDAHLADPWPEFARKFEILDPVFDDPAFVREYLITALEYLVQVDHLIYVELRTGLRPQAFEIIHQVRQEMQAQWPEFDLRVIINIVRYPRPGESAALAQQRFQDIMREAAKWVEKRPDLVVGFDLVAEEDGGLPSSYFAESFLKLRQEGVNLPLFLHAGESNRPANTASLDCEYEASCSLPFNNNLFDAVLLGTQRIGHGMALARLPALAERVREREIALEVCPISNQVLGYVSDLRLHPAATLINAGVPITLSSDDPGLFQYQGVTHDYWMATIAWNLGLAQLKWLAQNSLQYAALPDDEKQQKLNAWRAQWDTFIDAHD